MELNRDGKLARFYIVVGDGYLPNDFCTFFWGLIWRALKVAIGSLITLWVAVLVIWALVQIGIGSWHHPKSAGLVIIGVGVIALSFWKRNQLPVGEIADVASAKIDSIKKGYCPRIEWKGDDS